MDYGAFEDGFSRTSLGAIHFKHHPGIGEKLIFLHGMGGTTLVWKRLMEQMPDSLGIYLIDLLGHGGSDAPDIDYTVSMQFQALREFIALQNNGESYVFGHSYGAWVAAYYASQPCASKGIILEDPPGMSEYLSEMASLPDFEQRRAEMLKEEIKENNNEMVIRSMIYDNFWEDELTTQMLSAITRRTLILWGSGDRLVPLKYGMVLNGKIKGSKLEIIPNAGHNPHYEQPENVAKLILDFIGFSKA